MGSVGKDAGHMLSHVPDRKKRDQSEKGTSRFRTRRLANRGKKKGWKQRRNRKKKEEGH